MGTDGLAAQRAREIGGATKRPKAARLCIALIEPQRHELRPIGCCHNRLGPRATIAHPARDEGLPDTVVGKACDPRNLNQTVALLRHDHHLARQMRAVDIGNVGAAIAVEIADAQRGKPAVRLPDEPGGVEARRRNFPPSR